MIHTKKASHFENEEKLIGSLLSAFDLSADVKSYRSIHGIADKQKRSESIVWNEAFLRSLASVYLITALMILIYHSHFT